MHSVCPSEHPGLGTQDQAFVTRKRILTGRAARIFSLMLLFVGTSICLASSGQENRFRPNRVLVIIGDQWEDPSSYLVREGSEFHEIATLLKSWGIPFDVARLDQQELDRNLFLDYDGQPRYGAILWDADPARFKDRDYQVLENAAKNWNIGLVALSNRITHPVLESLLGIHYRGYYSSSSPILATEAEHFLIRGLPSPLDTDDDPRGKLAEKGVLGVRVPWPFAPFKKRVLAEARGARVIATQGGIPQITVRELRPGLNMVWIGGDYLQLLHYQSFRTILRRAVALAVGYQVFKDWSNDAILEMDDVGSAQNAWLEHWHYPTLSQEQIEKHLVEPLQKNHALLVVNACPGFVDRRQRTIVPSFRQVFVDEFGTSQDYVSTKRGLDEGIKRGVFEIQSHGWTHMQPDLNSPPGPWWDAPLYEEKAEVGWYREFGDTRRDREIPARVQQLHMARSREWIEREFGVTPLSFVAGGNGISESIPNNTTALAAHAGFGWFGDYIGPDMAIEAVKGYSGMGGSEFGGTADAPLDVPIPPDGHDRGIAQHPEEFPRIFEQLKGLRFMGMNEYVAYLHAVVSSTGGDMLVISFDYDPHYCRAFKARSSEWLLQIPSFEGKVEATIDGKARTVFFQNGVGVFEIPPGLKKHSLAVRWPR